MPLILHASTNDHDRWGGSKRYIRFIVYDTIAELQIAMARYRPDNNWSESAAVFSPAPDRERCNEWGEWVSVTPLHWAGVMRLSCELLNTEVITHECVHAGLAIYRMDVKSNVVLGYGCSDREETLAYILGDLTASVFDALHLSNVW